MMMSRYALPHVAGRTMVGPDAGMKSRSQTNKLKSTPGPAAPMTPRPPALLLCSALDGGRRRKFAGGRRQMSCGGCCRLTDVIAMFLNEVGGGVDD